MRFFTHLAFLLGLILLGLSSVLAQGYKSYLVYEGDRQPLKLTANQIITLTDEDDLVLTGAIKHSAPDLTAAAYMMRINNDGYQVLNSAIFTTQQNTQHEINSKTICQDEQGAFILGGSTNQVPNSPGGERMLSYMNDKGKVLWTKAQSEHDFESVLWDNAQSFLVALSNNEANTNPNTDIMISQLDASGNLINHTTLGTSTKDNAVKMILLEDGYALAATSDLNNTPQILVAYFDFDLNLHWAKQFSNSDYAHEVADIVSDGNGSLLIAGSSTNTLNGIETAFLMGIEETGTEQFYFHYFLDGDEQVRFTGIDQYTTTIDGRDSGLLLSGTYHDPSLPAERRTFVLNLRDDGSAIWGKSYSVFSPWTDFDFDEELSDILFIPNSSEFVTIGSFSRFITGTGDLDFRSALLVRSNVVNGKIDVQDGDCATELNFLLGSQTIQSLPVGSLYQNASNSTLTFTERNLEWDLRYCSYSLTKSLSQKTIKHPKIGFAVQASSASNLSYQLIGPKDWQSGSLELFDVRGAQLGTISVDSNQSLGEWELPKLSPGVYLVRLKVHGQYFASQKLLIQ